MNMLYADDEMTMCLKEDVLCPYGFYYEMYKCKKIKDR